MKKFYAFAAVAIMALAANAQNGAPLYITGDSEAFGPSKWNPDEPAMFEYVDGVYTFEIASLTQFKISTKCGPGIDEEGNPIDSWTNYDSAGIGFAGSKEDGQLADTDLDVPLTLVPWGSNVMCPWEGDYTIVVAGDLSTMTVTTTTPKPADYGQAPKVYLRGGFVDGWAAVPEWEMECVDKDNMIYKYVMAEDQMIEAGTTFKVADDHWGAINYTTDDKNMYSEVAYPVIFNSGDMAAAEDITGVIWIKCDKVAGFFEFAADKDYLPEWASAVNEISAENDAPAVYYNLQGVRVANAENGLFIVVKGNKTTKVLVK